MTSPDAPSDIQATIARLFVYPVKSCGGVELRESLLTETGLEFDRAWMVVDDAGEAVTQRQWPRMALVRPQLRQSDMVLRAPGMLALHVAFDRVEGPVRVRMWGDEIAAYDMGPVAAQWFSDFLSEPGASAKLRLVRFDPGHRRLSEARWTGGVEAENQFSDGFALLVTSEASLADLNGRLAAAGHAAVGIERFRPNIVLAGIEAHDEDRLDTLRIATDSGAGGDGQEARLRPVKPCTRCPIPDIDPATALRGHVVGDILQGYRRDERVGGAATFGMNAIVLAGVDRLLAVGQAVRADYVFE
jgi:uncharacterized protein YcbX